MVRFKNRYFLVELVPFVLDNSNLSSGASSKTNNRYHSNEISDKNDEILTNLPSISSASASSFIRNSVTINYGQFANASLLQSLSVKYTNSSTRMLILRAPREFQSKIWASMTFISEWPAENLTSLPSVKCTWRVVHCSGTIRSCQKAAILFAKNAIKESITEDCGSKLNLNEALEPLAKRIKSLDP